MVRFWLRVVRRNVGNMTTRISVSFLLVPFSLWCLAQFSPSVFRPLALIVCVQFIAASASTPVAPTKL